MNVVPEIICLGFMPSAPHAAAADLDSFLGKTYFLCSPYLLLLVLLFFPPLSRFQLPKRFLATMGCINWRCSSVFHFCCRLTMHISFSCVPWFSLGVHELWRRGVCLPHIKNTATLTPVLLLCVRSLCRQSGGREPPSQQETGNRLRSETRDERESSPLSRESPRCARRTRPTPETRR